VDLFLLAGFPNPLHGRAEQFLQRIAGTHAKVIATSSASYDGPLYRRTTVDTLLRAAAQFAVRRFKHRSDDQGARPRRIVLFYVPADDDQRLLDAFDFFVFPVPLRDLALFDEVGHQKRHEQTYCESAIQMAFEAYAQELVGIVQRRIEGRKSSEPLLLPPRNFHLSTHPLRETFRELTRRARTWDNPMPNGITAELFDRERLPKFLDHQEKQLIYRDARGVVFPCARASELHGQLLDIKTNAEPSALIEFLRSVYRFGTSLPDGFHHDAQFEGGRHFQKMDFQCSGQGTLLVTSSHANVYPNDYVRPAP
jgi:hypothetical protein